MTSSIRAHLKECLRSFNSPLYLFDGLGPHLDCFFKVHPSMNQNPPGEGCDFSFDDFVSVRKDFSALSVTTRAFDHSFFCDLQL